MRKRRGNKMVTIFTEIILILIIIILFLGITIAVIYSQVNSPFKITTTAGKNVDAEIKLSWVVLDLDIVPTFSANKFSYKNTQLIIFNNNDIEETKEKNFNNVVSKIGSEQAFVMRYALKNNNTENGLKFTMPKSIITTINMGVGYTRLLSEPSVDSISDIISKDGITLMPLEVFEFYIILTVDNYTQSANAIADYSFSLTSVI